MTDAMWLVRHREAGRLMSIARGRHLVIPECAAEDWAPHIVEAGWLVAVSIFGWAAPYLSGLTAAGVHGVPIRLGRSVHITGPVQRRDIALPSLPARVMFHQRAERYRDGRYGDPAVLMTIRGELCSMHVTSVEQTLLDLEHSRTRTRQPYAAYVAAQELDRVSDLAELTAISMVQRRRAAWGRLTGWRTKEPEPPMPR